MKKLGWRTWDSNLGPQVMKDERHRRIHWAMDSQWREAPKSWKTSTNTNNSTTTINNNTKTNSTIANTSTITNNRTTNYSTITNNSATNVNRTTNKNLLIHITSITNSTTTINNNTCAFKKEISWPWVSVSLPRLDIELEDVIWDKNINRSNICHSFSCPSVWVCGHRGKYIALAYEGWLVSEERERESTCEFGQRRTLTLLFVRRSITVQLTSSLTGLDSAALLIFN